MNFKNKYDPLLTVIACPDVLEESKGVLYLPFVFISVLWSASLETLLIKEVCTHFTEKLFTGPIQQQVTSALLYIKNNDCRIGQKSPGPGKSY